MIIADEVCRQVFAKEHIALIDTGDSREYRNLIRTDGKVAVITVYAGKGCDDRKRIYRAQLADGQIVTIPVSGILSFRSYEFYTTLITVK